MKRLALTSAFLLAVLCAAVSATASATVVTSPEGSLYTGEIHASSNTFQIHGEAFSLGCNASTISGTITSHGAGVTAEGAVSTFDISECTYPMTILKNGTLIFHATSGGNGTLTSTGLEITLHGPFGINCLYKTSATDIGTLTGSKSTGSTAKLDIDSSLVPRTGDSVFCGAFAEWTGSYTFSKPEGLTWQ